MQMTRWLIYDVNEMTWKLNMKARLTEKSAF